MKVICVWTLLVFSVGPLWSQLLMKKPPSDAEWQFLSAAAAENNGDIRSAVLGDLEAYIAAHAGSPASGEAQLLLAEVLEKKGDTEESAIERLKYLYEFPNDKAVPQVQRGIKALADGKIASALRLLLSDLAVPPEAEHASERLGVLWHRLAQEAPGSLERILEKEIPRFITRFPGYPSGDQLLADLAAIRVANSRPAAALLAHKKILAQYPASELRAQSWWSVGDLYEKLMDYEKAIAAYQAAADKYPKSPEALPSLEAIARLMEENQKRFELAVEAHEKIITDFPKNPSALKSYKAKARLELDELSRPAAAIKTYERMAQDFHTPDGFEALRQAAHIARKDLKNYRLEADYRRQAAVEFADHKDAAAELFAAGGIFEDDLKDWGNAAAVYRDLAAKYPKHKLARKASDRLARLVGAP